MRRLLSAVGEIDLWSRYPMHLKRRNSSQQIKRRYPTTPCGGSSTPATDNRENAVERDRRPQLNVHTTIQSIAEIATALGVAVGASQLSISRRQQTAVFEQQFTARYREIDSRLPLWALIGVARHHAYSTQDDVVRRAFYDYFELCDEEVFYHLTKRVSRRTWLDWTEGITANLRKPAFAAAWADISAAAPDQFELFREALQEFDL